MSSRRSDRSGLRALETDEAGLGQGTEAGPQPAAEGVDARRLGDRLKAGRLAQRLTIKALSEEPEIAVSATFLSRVERGDALPSEELLVKLAQRLGLDASELLLELFRERSSPLARPYIPSASGLGLQQALGGGQRLALGGLDALTGPLLQVVETHRAALEDNARLRDEVDRLSQQLVEKNRSFLPAVNTFLVSLFHYECELVRRETEMEPNGDAVVHYTLEGIRPCRDMRPITSLSHSIYIPLPPEQERTLDGAAVDFEVLSKPAGLELRHRLVRESSERASLEVEFPEGFAWSEDSPGVSYHFSYRLRRVFATTLEEAHARYGRSSAHSEMLEWASCFINKPVRNLEVAVRFPEHYRPKYIDRWVWWMEMSFLATDHNLADKLILGDDEGISVAHDRHTTVRLRVRNPLLGFNYGVVWQPLTKLELRRAAQSG